MVEPMKVAIVLFNLGGPDSLDAVQPFLRTLFSDPAISGVPGFIRGPLIAWRRAPVAQAIYRRIGGRSPILPQTEAQAAALVRVLSARHPRIRFRAFVSMRYWKPFSDQAVKAVKAFSPDELVLLPLYPQMSTTTSESSINDWFVTAKGARIRARTKIACCYPTQAGFIEASSDLIRDSIDKIGGRPYRLLFSAHGLPEKVIKRGDPYQWQVEQSAKAIVKRLGIPDLDWTVCYQSRVGPLKWIGPSTDAEIERAGRDRKAIVLFPVAFVSEHSETLVELDIEYRELAHKAGVPVYHRVATVGVQNAFIGGLASLVETLMNSHHAAVLNDGGHAACPAPHSRCLLLARSGMDTRSPGSNALLPAATMAGIGIAAAAAAHQSDGTSADVLNTPLGGSTTDHSGGSCGSGDTYSSDSSSSSSDSGSSSTE
jgi:protoporphyrin/coproporphyrin ferrochelatase